MKLTKQKQVLTRKTVILTPGQEGIRTPEPELFLAHSSVPNPTSAPHRTPSQSVSRGKP